MDNNTLGEWSDGEDEWIFDIDEDEILRKYNNGGDPIPNVSDEWSNSEDDELIRNINEDEILRKYNNGGDPIPNVNDEWSNSEDDELIRNINEDEILRGVNDNGDLLRNIDENQNADSGDSKDDDDPIPSKKRKAANQNVILSDSEDDDPIPTISDEGSNNQNESIPSNNEEDEQTGRGKKRKADDQNVEQEQDYYQIKPVREHYSQKFKMASKNYGVRFNNVLDDVNLLESRNRTYGIFDHLIKDVTEGMNSTDQVRFVLSSNQLQTPIAIPFCSLEELTTEKVLSHVEKVIQSNEEFRLNTTVNIDVIRVEMPHGSGDLNVPPLIFVTI